MNSENLAMNELSFASLLRASIGLSIVALGLCGFIYSAIATGLGQVVFPDQANGSMIEDNGKILGSRLVAQPFAQDKYFISRPSASNYDPMKMSGSNLARTNPELNKLVQQRLNNIATQNQMNMNHIPSDLVTASGSGIDPDISVQSAMIQVKRIAAARHLTDQEVVDLIQQHVQQPTFGILGQARVNVLELNLALDQIKE